VRGVGFVTGADVRLRFCPAGSNTGIVFVRTDLAGAPAVPARVANVTGTSRRTTLGHPPARVELVEHVLAALAGLRIDNCRVELDAPEPPGLDGSARGFAAALCRAGLCVQPALREVWTTNRPIRVSDGKATLTWYPGPADCLRVSYLLDFGWPSPLGVQRHTHDVTPEGFLNGLADSRTFILEAEIAALRQQGLGPRTTRADLLVFGPRGPVGNALRYADEPARHKALDLIGDLALFGHDLRGHLVACRSGHALNIAFARRLHEERELCRAARPLRAA
jgi:UDP-3-O-acyl N-acetylglucosamine deacetylase